MRYLAGIIAGSMTKTNVLGFVGGTNTPQVDRGVNACYPGAKSVNPDVKLKVRFIGSWSDEQAEREAAEKLIFEDGADTILLKGKVSDTGIGMKPEDIDKKADEIEEYFFKDDFENYGIKVHALKSASRLIGAYDLSDKAKALEEAVKEGNIDYVRDNNYELISQYRSYKDLLKYI